MAHNVESMAYVGEVPWHGLGVNVATKLKPGEKLTPEKFRRIAGLDWEVERAPVYMKVNGKYIAIPEHEALYRNKDAKFFDMITPKWFEVKVGEAFELFEEYCEAGGMEMHTAGSLGGGRYVWVLAKISNEEFALFKGKDRVENHLLFTLPMIYGKKVDLRVTPTRVVCENTLNMALRGNSDLQISLNHRKAFDAAAVKATLGLASDKMKKYEEMARFLASKKAKQDEVEYYFAEVFPSTSKKTPDNDNEVFLSRPARLALEALETQPGHEFGAGTWWAPFNAVTYNIDHVLGHNADTRLQSAWYGANRKKKVEALELALEYANAA